MTKPTVGPHIQAVMDRLDSEVGFVVSLGVAPITDAPYAVIYPDTGTVDSDRLCQSNNAIRVRFFVHAVGKGPEQTMWVMDQVRNALLGERLTVPGRRTNRITQTLGPQPMTRDLSTQPPVFLQVAEFRISSE